MRTLVTLFLLTASIKAAVFTISPGTHRYGDGSASLSATVTVTLSGTGTGSAFAYFNMAGKLMISLPPNLAGTCVGAPCTIFSGIDGNGSGLFASASSYPTSRAGDNSFAVDAIFSPDGSTSGATFALDDSSLFQYGGPGNFELGSKVYAESNGYMVGVRFNKPPTDATTTHAVSLWDANGQRLATANSSSETLAGWQTVFFSSPVPIQARVLYTASYTTTAPFWFNPNALRNRAFGDGSVHVAATYASSTGSCDVRDNWPTDQAGRPAAGLIGCLEITNGAITSIRNADVVTSAFATEGCQCMIGGIGPGPYKFQDNYLSAVGLSWHHDDSGLDWATRADYTYVRNTFFTPFTRMYGHPSSDGMRYMHRQPLEWKGGQRISLVGNIFDQSWVEGNPTGATITLTSINGQGITDVNVENNTFRHLPAVMGATQIVESHNPATRPTSRFRFRNNLAFDINQKMTYWVSTGGFNAPTGWLMAGPVGSEDVVIDHNSIIGNVGRAPSIMHLYSTKTEGVQVTNNIFYFSGGNPGLTMDGGVLSSACGGMAKSLADCMFTGGYRWDHNLLLGDTSQNTIQGYWSSLANYVPANPSDLLGVGWFSKSKDDYRMRNNYCSGCTNSASDGTDVGADVDALEASQGVVRLIGAPTASITTSSAIVAFVAPDAQACSIDYSSTDPSLILNFSRSADLGQTRTRSVLLTGLSSRTLYYYRVNCAVQQPTGQFRTR